MQFFLTGCRVPDQATYVQYSTGYRYRYSSTVVHSTVFTSIGTHHMETQHTTRQYGRTVLRSTLWYVYFYSRYEGLCGWRMNPGSRTRATMKEEASAIRKTCAIKSQTAHVHTPPARSLLRDCIWLCQVEHHDCVVG